MTPYTIICVISLQFYGMTYVGYMKALAKTCYDTHSSNFEKTRKKQVRDKIKKAFLLISIVSGSYKTL